ncbi:uncharacterized protein LOC141674792 [Apium graveolens]|uniref:uncharacterized protein LOC141674792 n=1 Tax=Apium graveolens TaxID=4045 RepID=UPI003D7AA652
MDRSTFMEMLREVQRGKNPTANGQDRDGQTMFDRFMKQRPNCFKEAKTPMDAEAWIYHMEKNFIVLEYSEVKKAQFSTYHLEGDANTWWKSMVASHAPGYENTLSWHIFKTQFGQRYFPASIREEYVREYQSIILRDDESVADFQVRFQRLAGYARYVAGSEADKIMKFMWALKNYIGNHIIFNRYTSMDTFVDSVRDQELHQVNFLKKRKREEEFSDRRHGFQKNGGSSGGFKPNDQRYNTRNFSKRMEIKEMSKRGLSTKLEIRKYLSMPPKNLWDRRDQGEKNNQKTFGRVFSITVKDAASTSSTISGSLFVGNGNAIVLFDTGSTHSFISTSYVKHLDIASTALISDFFVGTPIGVTILVNSQYLDCVVRVDDRELFVDLLPIQMRDFDIILGMD